MVLGDSDAQPAIDTDMVTVGHMTLTSGKRVLIVASFWQIDDATQQISDAACENPFAGAPGDTGFASRNADGAPMFLDLAAVQRPE